MLSTYTQMQWPTIEDAYETYTWWKPTVFDVSAPYAATRSFARDSEAAIAATEAEWRRAHAQAGNVSRELTSAIGALPACALRG